MSSDDGIEIGRSGHGVVDVGNVAATIDGHDAKPVIDEGVNGGRTDAAGCTRDNCDSTHDNSSTS